MGLTKVNGDTLKQILFSNKRIKGTTYDGTIVYIPFAILANMIYHTHFDVIQDKENFVVTDFTFTTKEK
jgi:hypothetical protein